MIDWKAIVEDYGPRVWRTVYRILADHADALDCYQETFLAAQRSPPSEPILDWGAYLATIGTRRAIDRLAERARQRALVTVLEDAAEHFVHENEPVDQVIGAELMDQVRLAMTQLPERQAEVFWLSCVEQLSHDRIAVQLHTTAGAVRVLLHRARTTLAAALKQTLTEGIDP